MQIVEKRFPKGAINQARVVQDQNITLEDLVLKINKSRDFEDYINNVAPKNSSSLLQSDVKYLVDLLETSEEANCAVLSNYAVGYMQRHYPNVSFEFIFLAHHALMAIGRPANSNPKDIKTWGEETLICDPWAKQIYLAADFPSFQKNAPDILVYALDNANNHCVMMSKGHYLAGEPEIYVNEASTKTDKMLVEMIKEEERRSQFKKINYSQTASDYVRRLEFVLGKEIIKRNPDKSNSIFLPTFWLKQLKDPALQELSKELEVDKKFLL